MVVAYACQVFDNIEVTSEDSPRVVVDGARFDNF